MTSWALVCDVWFLEPQVRMGCGSRNEREAGIMASHRCGGGEGEAGSMTSFVLNKM